jgi:hypothetical protein
MNPKALHKIQLVFLFASILFLAGVDVIWCMVKKMPPASVCIIFAVIILSISLRTFARRKNLILIVLSDIILIAFSHWTFTHRPLSWVIDHIFMEPTFLITVIAILIILGDWVIRIRSKSKEIVIQKEQKKNDL